MKKILKVFYFLLLFILPSCKSEFQNTNERKVFLNKCENVKTTFLISSVEQLNSIAHYEECLIYISLPGCEHCQEEKESLKEYIANTQALIYEVSRNTYLEAYDSSINNIGEYKGFYPKVTSYPSYLAYKNDTLLNYKKGSTGTDYNAFLKRIEEISYVRNFYCLNDYITIEDNHQFVTNEEVDETSSLDTLGYSTETLSSKIKENILVIYLWRRCNDCKEMKESFLNEFLYSTKKNIYYYECDGYFLLKRSSDPTLKKIGLNMWASFSTKFSLYSSSFYNTDENENKTGYVPTIVAYDNSSKKSSYVFLNENGYKQNEDKTISYANAFNEECLLFTSNTKVREMNDSDSNFIKAKNELKEKAKAIDIKKGKEYLKSIDI